ncbi:hypothetical protein HPP92_025721 [Vanilla planifolia]|uniref:Uncharacterized protein n=1 Tax=Vanilla planifolia TaxID=51239 RepID=A0A835PMV5_VANPL|nr:hypothetical protein HPP92_025721 [Vanilla planifolia]
MRQVSSLTLDLLRLGMALTSNTINVFNLLERTVGSNQDLSEKIAGLTLSLEHHRAVYDDYKAQVLREFPDLEEGAVGNDAGADAGGDGAPPS